MTKVVFFMYVLSDLEWDCDSNFPSFVKALDPLADDLGRS